MNGHDLDFEKFKITKSTALTTILKKSKISLQHKANQLNLQIAKLSLPRINSDGVEVTIHYPHHPEVTIPSGYSRS